MSTMQEIEAVLDQLSREEQKALHTLLGEKLGTDTSNTEASGVKIIDRATFDEAAEEIFDHFDPLLKKLAE